MLIWNSDVRIAGSTMAASTNKRIQIGQHVLIVLKQDQSSGKLTEGYVKDILTKAPYHPRGIKVRLTDGRIGRVQKILD